MPAGWDADLAEDDPLITLLVEVTAAVLEAGLPLHRATGAGGELGGACLTLEPELGGIVVTWRQHDRMSVDRVHGSGVDAALQSVMNRALADVLLVRGFAVETFPGSTGQRRRPGGLTARPPPAGPRIAWSAALPRRGTRTEGDPL